jgi:hypothetical protein
MIVPDAYMRQDLMSGNEEVMQISILRLRATQELMRLKMIIDNEVELLGTLENVEAREGLDIVNIAREDLRKSGETAINALTRLSNGMGEKRVTLSYMKKRTKSPRPQKIISFIASGVSALEAELAKSKKQLAEREKQIILLIEAGLEMAFRKEGLEHDVAKLRYDNDNLV